MRTPAVVIVSTILAATAAAQDQQPDPRITPVDPPAGAGSMAPGVAAHDGEILLTWLEPASIGPQENEAAGARSAQRLRLAWFRDRGAWSGPVTITESDRFFANWADTPGIISAGGDDLLAWWLQKSGDAPYAYDVHLALSENDGASWAELGKAHADDTETEHGFVSAVPFNDGVQVFWLDGRAMKPGSHEAGDDAGDMALRTRHIGRGEAESVVLDARVCECCNTSASLTSSGPVIVYRDRSETEVRDISIVRHEDGGWTEPHTIHDDGWEIYGCPVNGPAIDAQRDHLAVAWYTFADDDSRVQVMFSEDGGRTLGEPIRISDDRAIGRVDLLLDERGDALVSWLGGVGRGEAAIFLRRISPDGEMGEPIEVARTAAARASGFPRMAWFDDQVLIIWTEAEQTTRIRGALVDVNTE